MPLSPRSSSLLIRLAVQGSFSLTCLMQKEKNKNWLRVCILTFANHTPESFRSLQRICATYIYTDPGGCGAKCLVSISRPPTALQSGGIDV